MSVKTHIKSYAARLHKPLTGHPLHGTGPNRTIPGGAVVTVIENSDYDPPDTVYTASVEMDGVHYVRDIQPQDFHPIESEQDHQK